MMRRKPQLTFATVLHLAEMYCNQYGERNLCLSQEQNDAFFRDFVGQYLSAILEQELYRKASEVFRVYEA